MYYSETVSNSDLVHRKGNPKTHPKPEAWDAIYAAAGRPLANSQTRSLALSMARLGPLRWFRDRPLGHTSCYFAVDIWTHPRVQGGYDCWQDALVGFEGFDGIYHFGNANRSGLASKCFRSRTAMSVSGHSSLGYRAQPDIGFKIVLSDMRSSNEWACIRHVGLFGVK